MMNNNPMPCQAGAAAILPAAGGDRRAQAAAGRGEKEGGVEANGQRGKGRL